MKRSLLILSITLMAILVALPAGAGGESGHPLVGGWGVNLPGGPLGSMMTVNADGTFDVAQDTDDFADGFTHESTTPGVWKKTGPRTADLTTVGLVFDPNGNLFYYGRLRATVEASEDGNSFTATAFIDVFIPGVDGQDPLDPEAEPLGGTVGPALFEARRLIVMAIPELD